MSDNLIYVCNLIAALSSLILAISQACVVVKLLFSLPDSQILRVHTARRLSHLSGRTNNDSFVV